MLLLLSRRFNSVMSRININSSLWILSILTSALWDPSHSVKLSSCDVREGQSSNRLHLDCSNRNLKEIPRDLHNTGVVSADLSRNIFKILQRFSFRGLTSIRKLNISTCGIEKISSSTFLDLHLLEELDMKNNPIIGSGLPNGLFTPLPKLQHLFVSASDTSTSDRIPWNELSNLTEIIFTPGSTDSFRSLAALPNLKKAYFTYCRICSVLTPVIMQAFGNSTITEIAFIACDIKMIENGTFDGLSSLDVLNLAGNSQLKVDNVIDALSTSSDVTVKTLILDLVGSESSLFIAGLHERPSCRPAWKNLRKLSIRGINIVAINPRIQNCLPNLKAIAFGFNTIAKCGDSFLQCTAFLIRPLFHLRYIDMAYFMLSDTPGLKSLSGYGKSSNWVKLNEDYFPSFEEYTSEICNPYSSQSHFSISVKGSCHWIPFPPCLTYIKADHWFRIIFSEVQHRSCVQFANNTLKYINVSSRFSAEKEPLGFNRTVIGFSNLRIIDVSGFGLLFIDFDTIRNMPSLESLNLARNVLGHKQLPNFPRHVKLQELNMATNSIREFPADIFVNLVALRRLDISNNLLKSIRFKFPPFLDNLDLSGNSFASFESSSRLMMNALPSLVLHLDHNSFQCDCPETSFIEWYQKTGTNIINRQNITCQQGIRKYHIIKINTSQLEIKCGLTVNVVVISAVVPSVIVLMATLGVIIYRYRWIIRWRYYKLRYIRQRRNENMLLRDFNGELHYSSYVIYPYDDDRTTRWVTNILIPKVERTLQKPQMFIKGRDDFGGETFIDEIVRGIMLSQTAIWIICPEFFQDKYCETSAKFAFHQLGARNNLLVILENRFERYSVPKHFANMMHPNVDLTRVRYTDNEEGLSLFWAKLDNFLPAWSCINTN